MDSCRHHRRNSNGVLHHDAFIPIIRKSGLSVIRNLMNWKRFLSYKHHNLSAHHHYQIGAIFLFIFGFFLFFPFYMLVQELNLDILDWQWYFFWPWLIFYVVYCMQMRSKIPPDELRSPLLRPIGHWVLLGITTLMLYLQPAPLHSLKTIDIAFLVLSVFVADGYWDFRKLL